MEFQSWKQYPVEIIFHQRDNDGHCSAAIARHFFLGLEYQMNFHPWDYGRPLAIEEMAGRLVVMMDVCLPWPAMKRLAEIAGKVVWIDHHDTSISQQDEDPLPRDKVEAILSKEEAACGLTWAYFYPEVAMPRAVEAVSRYDSWTWQGYPWARAFQEGLAIENTQYDSELWTEVIAEDLHAQHLVDHIHNNGSAILQWREGQNKRLAERSMFPVFWEDIHLLGFNGVGNSSLFELNPWASHFHAGMTFVFTRGLWHFSLYRHGNSDRPEVDLSMLAKDWGGGGHKGAAGFDMDYLQWVPSPEPSPAPEWKAAPLTPTFVPLLLSKI